MEHIRTLMHTLFANKRIAIVGFGKEGMSTLQFFSDCALSLSHITIVDTNSSCVVPDIFPVCVQIGSDAMNDLSSFDVLFVSPGVSLYDERIYPYRAICISQIVLFFLLFPGKIIAVSGTKGKSTVVSVIHAVMQKADFDCLLIGNIGVPVLSILQERNYTSDTYAIIEVSSYMLDMLRGQEEILQNKKSSFFASILLNIYPDHLDRHHGFENYKNAKLWLTSGNFVHTFVQYDTIKKYITKISGIVSFGYQGQYTYHDHCFYSQEELLFSDDGILLSGDHVKGNMCSVLALAHELHISPRIVADVLQHFVGLPHRLQMVGTYNDITFIDDAISTTPESTIAAIETFGATIHTMFLGGTDRGYVFTELVQILEKYEIYTLVLFPPSGQNIRTLLSEKFVILQTTSMEEAVRFAYAHTPPHSICLLSTASPSYSNWKNFEEKGDLFHMYVKKFGTEK